MFENFYDNWWLNPNIFYAGATPDESEILERISKFELYPNDLGSKFHFVMHTSKVLQAAHLLDNTKRNRVIRSMIKIFDEMNLELIKAFVDFDEPKLKLKERTILDRILWARNFFMEFFCNSQFNSELEKIWDDVKNQKVVYSDITEYCISYCLSINNQDSQYLTDFAICSDNRNVRWFKIVDVDINVKKLNIKNSKLALKIRNKAAKHRKYIQQQFKESITKHYKSITGIEPSAN